jgi:hypothetical protein
MNRDKSERRKKKQEAEARKKQLGYVRMGVSKKKIE